jgi:multidrug resistance protein, MATE family
MTTLTVPRTSIALEMVKLATPIIGLNLAYALLGTTDTLFMGRIGKESVAAVGLGSLVYFTAFLLLRGTVNAIVTFASQAYGAGDLAACGRFLRDHLWLALMLCAAIPVYFLAFDPVIRLMGANENVYHAALEFARIRTFEIPFALVSTALLGFLVSQGDSRTPMLITWGMVLLNICFNVVLVFGYLGFPALGLRGSAIGTVISIVLGSIVATVIVLSKANRTKYAITFAWPKVPDLTRILRVGLPLGLLDFIEVAAFTAFLGVMARLGTNELAATQIANQISSLAFMPGFGLSTAAASLVGRFIGAQEPDFARRTGYAGVWLCMAWMGVIGVGFWSLSEPLMRAFTTDPDLIRLGSSLLRLMAFYQLFDAANIVFRGALIGAGDTRFTAIVTLILAWTVMVGGGYVFAFVLGWGLLGAWLGPFAYITFMALIYWQRWRSGVWLRNTI